MEDRIYSVYELNIMVKGFLEDNELFRDFFLTGEISNITYYKSGHLYFTLKDERASVKCVAFHYKYKKIGDNLKEGDLIKLFGRVSLYEANGSYQVLVSHIEKENKLGILYQELEKVKRELAEKGYFDEYKKKPIPKVPRTVGIVTSGTGAAIRDIINTGRSRFPNINFIVYPCKVQGEGSVEEIIKGIEILNKIDEVDVIIAGRGGGSIEDLWSFNIKETAMAFYNSKKPIVSAVGHEIDTVLTDYIADIRAATPTHASELVIPRKSDLKEKILMRNIRIRNLMKSRIEFEKERLVNKKDTYVLKNFLEIIREKNIFLMEKEERINSLLSHKIKEFRHQLQLKNEKIKGLNPKEILKRGYTITSKDGKVVKDLNNLHLGDKIETYFYTGKIISEVKEKL